MTELRVRKECMQKLFNYLESAHLLYRRCYILASDDVFVDAEAILLDVFVRMEDRIEEYHASLRAILNTM